MSFRIVSPGATVGQPPGASRSFSGLPPARWEGQMITSELLAAYLACPMKCYLRSTGLKCSENQYSAWYHKKTTHTVVLALRGWHQFIRTRWPRAKLTPAI